MSEFASSSSIHDSQNVPPGFMFKPSDEVLIDNYLIPKIESFSKKNKNKRPSSWFDIEERDVYKIEPWNLNKERKTYFEENEGYYFAKIKKSTTGKGICRESVKGYHWKNADGKKPICEGKASKTTLRFEAKAGSLEEFQKGWVIHEYRWEEKYVGSEWVLCRVKKEMKKTKPSVTPQHKLNEIEDHPIKKKMKKTKPSVTRQLELELEPNLNDIKDHVMGEEDEHVHPNEDARLNEIIADFAACCPPDKTPIKPHI